MSTVGSVAKAINSPLGIVLITGIGLLAAWPTIKSYLKGVGSKAPAANPTCSQTAQCGSCNANYSPVCTCGALGACGYACTLSSAIGCFFQSCDPVVAGAYASRLRRPNTSTSAGGIPTSNITRERSGAIQSWSKRPFQAGPSGCYALAYNSAPPDPKYTASILALNPRVKLKGT